MSHNEHDGPINNIPEFEPNDFPRETFANTGAVVNIDQARGGGYFDGSNNKHLPP